MLFAQDVLHAYTRISISMIVVFTSLLGPRVRDRRGKEKEKIRLSMRKTCPKFN